MSRYHRHHQAGQSYRELIATVQESASDLVEHQMTRDRERFAYEKQKLALLILLILSVWIMFFLLWERLHDFRPDDTAPAAEHLASPPSDPPTHFYRDSQAPASPIYAL